MDEKPEVRVLYVTDPKAAEGRNLEDMQDFLKTIPRDQLEIYILDMFWKGQKVSESDLYRAFVGKTRYDIDLVHRVIKSAPAKLRRG